MATGKKQEPGNRLGTEAYHKIREAILAGDLPPASPLSRRRLAEQLGVSTLPIGSALQRLEAEGFVESRPRAGTRVKVPSPSEIRGNYVVREALETQAARLFAETATPAQREAILEAARKLDEHYARLAGATRYPHVRVEKLHVGFHGRIARATGCDELVQAIDRSRVLLFNWLFSHSGTFQPLPPRWHGDLAEKLVSGDAATAAEAMRIHVRFRMDEVIARFTKLAREHAPERITRGPQRRTMERAAER